jgi:hypothetical protein
VAVADGLTRALVRRLRTAARSPRLGYAFRAGQRRLLPTTRVVSQLLALALGFCTCFPSAALVARTALLTNTQFGGTTACLDAQETNLTLNIATSPNGAWKLKFQTDTNIVLYNSADAAAGNCGTTNTVRNSLTFCDLVVTTGGNVGSSGNGWFLCLSADGKVNVHSGGDRTWGDTADNPKYTFKNWVAPAVSTTLALFIDDAGAVSVGDPTNGTAAVYTVYTQPATTWSPPPPSPSPPPSPPPPPPSPPPLSPPPQVRAHVDLHAA